MAKRKLHEELSVMDAVENLSSMAELDVKALEQEAAVVDSTQEGLIETAQAIQWLNPEKIEQNRETVKETFRVLHNYLRNLYEREKSELQDPETQKGIQAIMVLAGEAAQKVDKYTFLFKGVTLKESITELKEYQELQQFYLTKIMKRFQEALETEEAWQAEWGNLKEDVLDIERRGLKDLETVRRDKEYELFYIRKEDGKPFFNRNLLRHIRLVGNFDETVSDPTGEDPFLKIKIIQDKDVHASAKQILKLASPYIDEFYKEAMRYKEIEFVSSLNKALMALMLTANPRNLIQNTTGKNCISYYTDFHFYLRLALNSDQYKKYIAALPESSERFSHSLLNLSHALCCFFFMRIGSRKEAIEFIHRLIQKAHPEEKKEAVPQKTHSIWHSIFEEDERIRHLLKLYPNGPLLKTLDVFREGEEHEGFDPISQENLPSQMYTFSDGEMHVSCLRIPSPTRQEFIHQVEVIDEFRGFLRALTAQLKGQKHLLINLQDRTSWKEHARCIVLEEMQKDAEFSKNLFVITLPKNTDFYLQTDPYQNLNQAPLFLEQLKEQIASAEECGFYFPLQLKSDEFSKFIDQTSSLIHELFFGNKSTLTRKNRLDFIEIFYQFLILKIIEVLRPDSISFSCKDAIDVGAAAAAGFFAFLRILSNKTPWTKAEKDFLLWMFYSPALLIRERAIDIQRFNRIVSALAIFQSELDIPKNDITAQFKKLYQRPQLSQLKIQEAA